VAFQPMSGVKIVEVAQYTFTPAAGAVLADWGAEVIKVEHAVTGDAQRGIQVGTGGASAGSFQPMMEHPNRGKRSIGLALENPAGREVLMELVADADVFLTNFLPAARRRLGLELEDIRAANPDIIYVRGSGHGQRGPDAEKGGFDGSTFWGRMGTGWGTTPPDSPRLITMPSGAYGDSIGGMTIAGGIAGALFARERTGETSVVDVSLMSVGAWMMALSLCTEMLTGEVNEPLPLDSPPSIAVNPLIGNFRTSDGRWINLCVLQPSRFWVDACQHLGLDDLAKDERYADARTIMAEAVPLGERIAEAFASQTYGHWLEALRTFEGQWAPVQNPTEIVEDPQMEANGYLLPVTDAEGNDRRLVANPVQFDEVAPTISRAPQFAEHTDEILRELGRDDEQILQLKIDGACT
jgi:crotonobetainyl-CoA:carnitine CoA-transferase CaiB-like acyl-CoA transferase